jgi:hypothetical protein
MLPPALLGFARALLAVERTASPRAGPRHHPNAARTLLEHHRNSPTRRGPTSLRVGRAPMKMLDREGFPFRLVRACVDPLAPQAVMSIPRRREVQRLSIRRPVGPIFSPFLRDL